MKGQIQENIYKLSSIIYNENLNADVLQKIQSVIDFLQDFTSETIKCNHPPENISCTKSKGYSSECEWECTACGVEMQSLGMGRMRELKVYSRY
jgi:hypothetical protein